jgi:hypothetical protein
VPLPRTAALQARLARVARRRLRRRVRPDRRPLEASREKT